MFSTKFLIIVKVASAYKVFDSPTYVDKTKRKKTTGGLNFSCTDHLKGFGTKVDVMNYAAQLRQPIENSLVLCHLKTLRLYSRLFKFELDHYLTNVARVESTYWG